jgi:hypothetical protein
MKKFFVLLIVLILITLMVSVSIKNKANNIQAKMASNELVENNDKDSEEYKRNQTLSILKSYEGKKQGNYSRALLEKIREINDENDVKVNRVVYMESEEQKDEAQYGTETYSENINKLIQCIDVDLEYDVTIKDEDNKIEVIIKTIP